VRRREFITLFGGAAAVWSFTARAQQPMPMVGLLGGTSPDTLVDRLRAFRQGLKDTGYIEGENLAIEYRWAQNQSERLPELAADLVRRKVAVIVATGGLSTTLAAKAATSTIPIVFGAGEDPVRLGLVASLARPGGNLTGINFFSSELAAKRLGLLHELVPTATRVAVLVNPTNATNTETTLRDVEPAARALGLRLRILHASTSREIDTAFATFHDDRPHALFVGQDVFFVTRRVQLANLASRHVISAVYGQRDYVEAGGLMSYGSNFTDAHRQIGIYTGRILNGTKPADLPVVQSSKLELLLNLATARAIGLDIPPTLLARADEVIE
jgi:putative tryptophan/tyrosine transport system substrate-binding protein